MKCIKVFLSDSLRTQWFIKGVSQRAPPHDRLVKPFTWSGKQENAFVDLKSVMA